MSATTPGDGADLDRLLRPATDDDLWLFNAETTSLVTGQGRKSLGPFSDHSHPAAISHLAAAGIDLQAIDLIALHVALGTFYAGYPSLHHSEAALAKERRIAELSAELSALLADDEDDGCRFHWGAADWAGAKKTLRAPEPQATVPVADLRQSLAHLEAGALERVEWIASAKDLSFAPGPAAKQVRYFYWLVLMAFWKFHLRRSIATCVGADGRPSGPLIDFILQMSAKDLPGTISPGAIRRFIRDGKDRLQEFEQLFTMYREHA